MSGHALKQKSLTNIDGSSNALGRIIGSCAQQGQYGEPFFQLINSDLDQGLHQAISLPFFGHGIAQRTDDHTKLAVFEKRGKGACEIDLANAGITRMIGTHPDREFYGHGCYVDSLDVLLAAETVVGKNHEGLLVVRDKNTLQELDTFPSFGSRPHDVHLLEDNKTLLVTNGGGLFGEAERGSVVFIDIASKTLIDKYEIKNNKVNAGHVALAANGNIVAVSAPRDGTTQKKPIGAISIGGVTRPFARAAAPSLLEKRLFGETLSTAIEDNRALALTTTPDANLVLIWDVDSGALLKKLVMQMPKGICISNDHQYAIVSNIKNGPGIDFIDLDKLEIVETMRVQAPYTGSHLFQLRL